MSCTVFEIKPFEKMDDIINLNSLFMTYAGTYTYSDHYQSEASFCPDVWICCSHSICQSGLEQLSSVTF